MKNALRKDVIQVIYELMVLMIYFSQAGEMLYFRA